MKTKKGEKVFRARELEQNENVTKSNSAFIIRVAPFYENVRLIKKIKVETRRQKRRKVGKSWCSVGSLSALRRQKFPPKTCDVIFSDESFADGKVARKAIRFHQENFES